MNARPVEILLIEDDDDDVRLITRALRKSRILNSLQRVGDGVQAMKYLRREPPYTDAVRPDLMLLDLNMPKMDGREVLMACKSDADLANIPIVVFTSSDDEGDVLDSYKHRASSFVTKPVDIAEFREVLLSMSEYWFCVVTLPGEARQLQA